MITPGNVAWLGGSDEYSEGVWTWINGSKWTLTDWGGREPSNSHEAEHSLTIGSEGQLIDFFAARPTWFVCEWDDAQLPAVKWPPAEVERKLAQIAEDFATVPRAAFNGHSYVRVPERLMWHDAVKVCQLLGGYLCCVETAEEQTFLQDQVMVGSENNAWLGGTDENDGEWRWVNGSRWSFHAFRPGEPNNGFGGEHFTMLLCGEPGWNDYFGSARNSFICEWDTTPSPNAAPVAPKTAPRPRVTLKTTKGDIVLELFADKTPRRSRISSA